MQGSGPLLSAEISRAFAQASRPGEDAAAAAALFACVDVLKTGVAAACEAGEAGAAGGRGAGGGGAPPAAAPPPCLECFDLPSGRALPFRLAE